MYSVSCLSKISSLVEGAGLELGILEGKYKGKHDFIKLCHFIHLTSKRNYGNRNGMAEKKYPTYTKKNKKNSRLVLLISDAKNILFSLHFNRKHARVLKIMQESPSLLQTKMTSIIHFCMASLLLPPPHKTDIIDQLHSRRIYSPKFYFILKTLLFSPCSAIKAHLLLYFPHFS